MRQTGFRNWLPEAKSPGYLDKLKIIMKKIHKGDTVQIMVGKDSGKTGAIERVLTKDSKVLIAGVNMVKRHVKGREGIEGGIIDLPKPVDISNVQIVCKSCKKITRVGFKLVGNDKLRICRKCQEVI